MTQLKKLLRKAKIGYQIFTSFGLFQTHRDYIRFLRCLLTNHPQSELAFIKVKRHHNPLACRPGTTDAYMLWHTLVDEQHKIELPADQPSVIFDLGANVGYTAVEFAKLYPAARIVAVELDADNAEVARQNISPFSERCTLIEGAVWSSDGQINYGGGGAHGLRVNGTETHSADRFAPAYTIETLMSMVGVDQIDFLKMDIEGAEAEVVQENASWLKRVKILNLEVHLRAISPEEGKRRLEASGFTVAQDKQNPKWMWAYQDHNLDCSAS